MMLYELNTGAPYFENKSPVTITKILPSEGFTIDVSKVENEKLRDLIEQLLAIDPNKRPDINQYFMHPFFSIQIPTPLLTLLILNDGDDGATFTDDLPFNSTCCCKTSLSSKSISLLLSINLIFNLYLDPVVVVTIFPSEHDFGLINVDVVITSPSSITECFSTIPIIDPVGNTFQFDISGIFLSLFM